MTNQKQNIYFCFIHKYLLNYMMNFLLTIFMQLFLIRFKEEAIEYMLVILTMEENVNTYFKSKKWVY